MTVFHAANARIAALVADPLIADDVRAFAEQRRQVNERGTSRGDRAANGSALNASADDASTKDGLA